MPADKEHPLIAQVIAGEPDIGSGDESKCLPGWLNSFCEWFEKGEPRTFSHGEIRALCHTLIAARQRARRLAKERDEARGTLALGDRNAPG